MDRPRWYSSSTRSHMRVFVWIITPRYTGTGVSLLWLCLANCTEPVLLRRRAQLLNYRSWEIVSVGAGIDEWLDCSWILGPFKIIETSIMSAFGTDSSWQRVSNDPLKAVVIFSMSLRTMLAALARWMPSLSASCSHAMRRDAPTSWLKASRMSRPRLCSSKLGNTSTFDFWVRLIEHAQSGLFPVAPAWSRTGLPGLSIWTVVQKQSP